jgi:hypothetical protein
MFDSLFEGVFKTVPISDANACMLFAKIVVRPDSNVFVVQVPIDFIVWLVGEGISAVGRSGFVFKYDVVLLPLGEVSCDARPDFAGVTVVSEVCMVGVDYDGDRSSF